jgi:hypothetical protein
VSGDFTARSRNLIKLLRTKRSCVLFFGASPEPPGPDFLFKLTLFNEKLQDQEGGEDRDSPGGVGARILGGKTRPPLNVLASGAFFLPIQVFSSPVLSGRLAPADGPGA